MSMEAQNEFVERVTRAAAFILRMRSLGKMALYDRLPYLR